jgi:hypothetical protein
MAAAMAAKITVVLDDDLDGGPADEASGPGSEAPTTGSI